MTTELLPKEEILHDLWPLKQGAQCETEVPYPVAGAGYYLTESWISQTSRGQWLTRQIGRAHV